MNCIEIKNEMGLIMAYYSNDQYIVCETMFSNKIYEQDIVLNILSPFIKNSIKILDIGGHVGSHSILYSSINPNSTIYTFEPQQKLYELLKENIYTNKCKNIIPYNIALGNFNGTFTLSLSATDGDNVNTPVEYGTDKSYNLGGVGFGLKGEEVAVNTGDSFNLTDVGFIKIDVEGAEKLVIIGLENTIKTNHPTIFYEDNRKCLDDETLKQLNIDEKYIHKTVSDILKEWGYKNFEKIEGQNILAKY